MMHGATNPLVGKWFHSIVSNRVVWQGQIIGNPEPFLYLIQLYEWFFGMPSDQMIVGIKDMAGWLFYTTSDEMKYSYDYGTARALRNKK